MDVDKNAINPKCSYDGYIPDYGQYFKHLGGFVFKIDHLAVLIRI